LIWNNTLPSTETIEAIELALKPTASSSSLTKDAGLFGLPTGNG
jgi:hypothetical protein